MITLVVSQCVGGSKGLTGASNYQDGSCTPVITFDLVVIPLMVGSYTPVVGSYTPARKIQSTTINYKTISVNNS